MKNIREWIKKREIRQWSAFLHTWVQNVEMLECSADIFTFKMQYKCTVIWKRKVKHGSRSTVELTLRSQRLHCIMMHTWVRNYRWFPQSALKQIRMLNAGLEWEMPSSSSVTTAKAAQTMAGPAWRSGPIQVLLLLTKAARIPHGAISILTT